MNDFPTPRRLFRRLLALLMIGAALPLIGCASLADVATQRCSGRFSAASSAYQSCWQREYWGQMHEMEERNQRRIELEMRAPG
jgi:hypothetical protein